MLLPTSIYYSPSKRTSGRHASKHHLFKNDGSFPDVSVPSTTTTTTGYLLRYQWRRYFDHSEFIIHQCYGMHGSSPCRPFQAHRSYELTQTLGPAPRVNRGPRWKRFHRALSLFLASAEQRTPQWPLVTRNDGRSRVAFAVEEFRPVSQAFFGGSVQ